jgi:hypothetical protein
MFNYLGFKPCMLILYSTKCGNGSIKNYGDDILKSYIMYTAAQIEGKKEEIVITKR